MKMAVTRIKAAEYVDCSISDCFPDGFWQAGRVSLRTVDPVPVSELPEADCVQFGHETAHGCATLSLKTAKKMFGIVHVGDVFEVKPKGIRRNREMRAAGTFRVYL